MNTLRLTQFITSWRGIIALIPWLVFACCLGFALIIRWTPLGNKSYLSPLISSASLNVVLSACLAIWLLSRFVFIGTAGTSFFRSAGLFLGLLFAEGVGVLVILIVWALLMMGPIYLG